MSRYHGQTINHPRMKGITMHLSRFVMWRIAAVSIVILVCALSLALWQARFNIAREEHGAVEVARLFDQLAALESAPADAIASHLDVLRQISSSGNLRHLRLRLQDSGGRDLLAQPRTTSSLLQRGYAWLLPPDYDGAPPTPPQWTLQRADGRHYHVTLLLDPASERNESLTDIAGLLGVLLGYSALMLLAIGIALHLALRPMRDILHAIDEYGHSHYDFRLPPMRLVELHSIAQALTRMAHALAHGQKVRQRLDLQMRTMQEDERGRLARELHDEFGQRLTAMRANAAWLVRSAAAYPDLQNVAKALANHCEHVQLATRDLLHRLRSHGAPGDDEPLPLQQLLTELVDSWRERPDQHTSFSLQVTVDDGALSVDVALAVYRLTQEALTNVARHANATTVSIRLKPLAGGRLEWSVRDNGTGVADAEYAFQQGSGITGMRERVWALHGDIDMLVADPDDPGRPGMYLRARLPLALAAAAPL
ncbi:MAG: histidine kinase [Rhodanobacter sp.]